MEAWAMGGFSYGKSSSWAISGGGAAGVVAYAGASVYLITLFDVENQIFFSGAIAGSSIGAGLKAGATVATFSPSFFTVSSPMYASDFDNSLCGILDVSFVALMGASATGLTIYGVSHSPSVLFLGGVGAGVAVGLTLSPLMYMYIDSSSAYQNNGCLITPTGDPLCGGYSSDPRQSTDPGQSSN
jgi:hypothetical protein